MNANGLPGQPILCLALGKAIHNALLFSPGESPRTAPRFVLPAAPPNRLFWQDLCRAAGLPSPGLLAAAAQDDGFVDVPGANPGQVSGFTARWSALAHRHAQEGIPPEALVYAAAPAALPRLAALQAATGGPVAEHGAALLLGLLALPEIAERSYRQGVLLIAADSNRLTASLVFQERILGVYERSSSRLDPSRLARDVEEFRLGWLPDEQVRQTGGHGCFILELPPEAEGFKPIYITGPQRYALHGMGNIAAPYDDCNQTACFGLLHGLGCL